MTNQIEIAIYEFVLNTGGTSPQQIEQWAIQSGLNIQEVIPVFRSLLSSGAIYYYKKGIIVANRKKSPTGVSSVPQQQVQQRKPNPFGGSSNYKPPGVGRMRV